MQKNFHLNAKVFDGLSPFQGKIRHFPSHLHKIHRIFSPEAEIFYGKSTQKSRKTLEKSRKILYNIRA